jgi:hypothetical protein
MTRLVVVATLAIAAPAFAQVQVGSGRALDGSLRLGSGGYNARTQVAGPGLNARPFEPYRGRFAATSRVRLDGPITFEGRRTSTRDVFASERSYRAGWQRAGAPGASPATAFFDPGAYRIDGRVR